MITFSKMHDDLNKSGNPCSYWGEHGDWLVAMGRHRDSDILTNCNWDVFREMLDALGGDETAYRIESESHWAVGWVEHLLINPVRQDAIDLAAKVQSDIDDYPILDDEAFSTAEYEAFEEAWASWGANELRKELVNKFKRRKKLEAYLDDVDDWTLADWWQNVSCQPYYCDNSGCVMNTDYHVKEMSVADLNDLLKHCDEAKTQA